MGLVGRSYETSFADRGTGLESPQTSCVKSGPNLLRTTSPNRLDVEPVCLGQGDGLPGFQWRCKDRQQNDSRSQQAQYAQGRYRFDHLMLLTVAVSRSRRARGSIYNKGRGNEFPPIQLIFVNGPTSSAHTRWRKGSLGTVSARGAILRMLDRCAAIEGSWCG